MPKKRQETAERSVRNLKTETDCQHSDDETGPLPLKTSKTALGLTWDDSSLQPASFFHTQNLSKNSLKV